MMISPAAATPSPSDGLAAPAIYDVTTAEFEDKVMRASMEAPVLVDFWAPWCGPCKQLMPVLEAAVREAGGKVRLAKVNIDNNPELAQALRVQSVPTVFAFFRGQPVTAFTGARPASEIKSLIGQLMRMAQQSAPGAPDIPATLTAAGQALATGDPVGAQDLYALVLEHDPNNGSAYAGLIRTFIATGEFAQAQELLDNAPAALVKDSHLAAVRTALELAQAAPASGNTAALRAALDKNSGDLQARFDLALILFAQGDHAGAVDHLIDIIRRNRTWEEDKARLQLLKFFDAMGPADPETAAGRRKLSGVLFS